MEIPTLSTCDSMGLREILKVQHPTRTRHDLIFAAGALNNINLKQDLGNQELANFYDGMVAAGHIDENPYWPRHGRKRKRF